MKNVYLIAGAALTLSAVAFAAPDDKGKKAEKTDLKCAVMSDHTVNIKDATAKGMFADYKGNRYYFCCGGCPATFKKDPAKFAKADHTKAPKAPKVKKS